MLAFVSKFSLLISRKFYYLLLISGKKASNYETITGLVWTLNWYYERERGCGGTRAVSDGGGWNLVITAGLEVRRYSYSHMEQAYLNSSHHVKRSINYEELDSGTYLRNWCLISFTKIMMTSFWSVLMLNIIA